MNSTGTFRLNLSEEINWEELNTIENAQFPPIVPLSIPPSVLDSFSSPKFVFFIFTILLLLLLIIIYFSNFVH